MAARPLPLPMALAAALALAGCVSQGPFPSLAPRPEEGDISTAEPARPDPVSADDVALRARIGALVTQAREGMRAFEAAYMPAARATGDAGARSEGSEGWVAAQQAISRVEAARSLTTNARAELDRIAVARANAPTSAGDRQALVEALAEVERIGREQQVGMQRLLGQQPGR